MATSGLEVRLRAGAARAEVTRFTHTIDQVVLALREIDSLYVHRPPERAKWVVADLRRDADILSVRVEAQSGGKRPREDLLVSADVFVEGAQILQVKSEVPPLYSPQTVERVGKIATPRGGVEDVVVATYNGRTGDWATLSKNVREHAQEAVRGREESFGSFCGLLEVLARPRRNSNTLKVSIYDEDSRHAIVGIAPSEMESQMHELFGERVLAGGMLIRNSSGQPIRINLKQLERLESPPYPSTSDLLGVEPDWLGGIPVDQYIAEVRRRA